MADWREFLTDPTFVFAATVADWWLAVGVALLAGYLWGRRRRN